VATEHPDRSTMELRYLDANHVEHPTGTLQGVLMCTVDDEQLGSVDGVLVEPASRRLRYFVVERSSAFRRRRYLLAADLLATLDEKTLRVHAHAEDLERFDPRSVRAFSKEDVITAMFAQPAA
jgi:uncharacterized protein YrrD